MELLFFLPASAGKVFHLCPNIFQISADITAAAVHLTGSHVVLGPGTDSTGGIIEASELCCWLVGVGSVLASVCLSFESSLGPERGSPSVPTPWASMAWSCLPSEWSSSFSWPSSSSSASWNPFRLKVRSSRKQFGPLQTGVLVCKHQSVTLKPR